MRTETTLNRTKSPYGVKNPRVDTSREKVLLELDYDKGTGRFRRRLTGVHLGTANSGGYLQIWIKGTRYYAHRLVWLIETGSWPTHEIDHVNGDRSDNRFENLRDVTHRENVIRGNFFGKGPAQ